MLGILATTLNGPGLDAVRELVCSDDQGERYPSEVRGSACPV